jgi:hypothetical protein
MLLLNPWSARALSRYSGGCERILELWLTIPALSKKQIRAEHDSILLLRLVTMISHRQLSFTSWILVRRPSVTLDPQRSATVM